MVRFFLHFPEGEQREKHCSPFIFFPITSLEGLFFHHHLAWSQRCFKNKHLQQKRVSDWKEVTVIGAQVPFETSCVRPLRVQSEKIWGRTLRISFHLIYMWMLVWEEGLLLLTEAQVGEVAWQSPAAWASTSHPVKSHQITHSPLEALDLALLAVMAHGFDH